MGEAVSDALARVVEDVVAPQASAVDEGKPPFEAIDALGRAGILGLTVNTEAGGRGGTLRDAVTVIRRLSSACGSTAMVVLMHYAGTAVIEAHGPMETRQAIGGGRHLTTLAFSEAGSRSH